MATTMNPWERVSAVLAGRLPDQAPVSFWYHFPAECRAGQAAVDAHLSHLRRYELDFLKIMNDNPFPGEREIHTVADLRNLPVLAGDEGGYGEQLALIRALAAELAGKVMTTTTLFNAWAVLRRLVHPPIADRHGPPSLSSTPTAADRRVSELLSEDRAAVAAGLSAIAASQANFARKCIEAGADGVFLSVRDDWVNTDANGRDAYDEMVRTGDLQILDAAAEGRFNLLHVCGVPQDFTAFAAYPVHVINWADRAAGPAISEAIERFPDLAAGRPAICGGVDNLGTLVSGSPDDVANEVRDALRQAAGCPVMISPGCTFDPDHVPPANLSAIVRASRAA